MSTLNKISLNGTTYDIGGGDSKIETLDITGGKDITALLNEGNHIYCLTCDNEEDYLRFYMKTVQGKTRQSIKLFKGTIVSSSYTETDKSLLITYFGSGVWGRSYYGTAYSEGVDIKKSTQLIEMRTMDMGYVTASTNTNPPRIMADYINLFLVKKTVPVFLNGSGTPTNLDFLPNTIIIGKCTDFIGTVVSTGLIIFPTGTFYKITKVTLTELHIEELPFATEDYVKSREMSNLEPGDGTGLFGWYSSTPSGGSLTENGHVTPNMVENIKVGQVYEWPSTVYVDGQNRAVVIGTTKVYDNWSVTRASGGESSYKTFIIYLGNGNVYTYAFDDTNVYKETYPSDK